MEGINSDLYLVLYHVVWEVIQDTEARLINALLYSYPISNLIGSPCPLCMRVSDAFWRMMCSKVRSRRQDASWNHDGDQTTETQYIEMT